MKAKTDTVKVVELRLKEYTIAAKPDYRRLGTIVDTEILRSFPDGKYVVRAIGSADHPGFTLDKLTEIVLRTGTDKYDPSRKSVCHEEFSGYDYDIQATSMEIRHGKLVLTDETIPTVFGDIIFHFYEHAPLDRGYPVRIDVLLIYDAKRLKRARKVHAKAKCVRKGLNRYLYKFVDAKNKRAALLGIVMIKR